nr:hypothetical protein [Pseudomonadota bacterium]
AAVYLDDINYDTRVFTATDGRDQKRELEVVVAETRKKASFLRRIQQQPDLEIEADTLCRLAVARAKVYYELGKSEETKIEIDKAFKLSLQIKNPGPRGFVLSQIYYFCIRHNEQFAELGEQVKQHLIPVLKNNESRDVVFAVILKVKSNPIAIELRKLCAESGIPEYQELEEDMVDRINSMLAEGECIDAGNLALELPKESEYSQEAISEVLETILFLQKPGQEELKLAAKLLLKIKSRSELSVQAIRLSYLLSKVGDVNLLDKILERRKDRMSVPAQAVLEVLIKGSEVGEGLDEAIATFREMLAERLSREAQKRTEDVDDEYEVSKSAYILIDCCLAIGDYLGARKLYTELFQFIPEDNIEERFYFSYYYSTRLRLYGKFEEYLQFVNEKLEEGVLFFSDDGEMSEIAERLSSEIVNCAEHLLKGNDYEMLEVLKSLALPEEILSQIRHLEFDSHLSDSNFALVEHIAFSEPDNYLRSMFFVAMAGEYFKQNKPLLALSVLERIEDVVIREVNVAICLGNYLFDCPPQNGITDEQIREILFSADLESIASCALVYPLKVLQVVSDVHIRVGLNDTQKVAIASGIAATRRYAEYDMPLDIDSSMLRFVDAVGAGDENFSEIDLDSLLLLNFKFEGISTPTVVQRIMYILSTVADSDIIILGEAETKIKDYLFVLLENRNYYGYHLAVALLFKNNLSLEFKYQIINKMFEYAYWSNAVKDLVAQDMQLGPYGGHGEISIKSIRDLIAERSVDNEARETDEKVEILRRLQFALKRGVAPDIHLYRIASQLGGAKADDFFDRVMVDKVMQAQREEDVVLVSALSLEPVSLAYFVDCSKRFNYLVGNRTYSDFLDYFNRYRQFSNDEEVFRQFRAALFNSGADIHQVITSLRAGEAPVLLDAVAEFTVERGASPQNIVQATFLNKEEDLYRIFRLFDSVPDSRSQTLGLHDNDFSRNMIVAAISADPLIFPIELRVKGSEFILGYVLARVAVSNKRICLLVGEIQSTELSQDMVRGVLNVIEKNLAPVLGAQAVYYCGERKLLLPEEYLEIGEIIVEPLSSLIENGNTVDDLVDGITSEQNKEIVIQYPVKILQERSSIPPRLD